MLTQNIPVDFCPFPAPFAGVSMHLYMMDSAHLMAFGGDTYEWHLDHRVVTAHRTLESPTAHEKIIFEVKRIDSLTYADNNHVDTVMTVKGVVAETRITSIDTVWIFGGTLYKK